MKAKVTCTAIAIVRWTGIVGVLWSTTEDYTSIILRRQLHFTSLSCALVLEETFLEIRRGYFAFNILFSGYQEHIKSFFVTSLLSFWL